jgi:hypothetical protein
MCFRPFDTCSSSRWNLEGAAFENQEETTRKLLKAVEEFSTYIEGNRGFIKTTVSVTDTVKRSARVSLSPP